LLDAAAAPGNFAKGHSTEATVLRAGYGDLDGAFAGAHIVVELDLTIGRHSAVPLETRGAASLGPEEQIVWREKLQVSKSRNPEAGERRLNVPYSAVIPPSTNSRAPVT
jgi:hypothetical protein